MSSLLEANRKLQVFHNVDVSHKDLDVSTLAECLHDPNLFYRAAYDLKLANYSDALRDLLFSFYPVMKQHEGNSRYITDVLAAYEYFANYTESESETVQLLDTDVLSVLNEKYGEELGSEIVKILPKDENGELQPLLYYITNESEFYKYVYNEATEFEKCSDHDKIVELLFAEYPELSKHESDSAFITNIVATISEVKNNTESATASKPEIGCPIQ